MNLGLQPRASITPAELSGAVPWVVREATLAEIMNTLTAGTLLCAFAVTLGASNTVVGLVAGIAPLFQVLQLAATGVVERTRRRKLVATVAAFAARALWLAVAVVALLPVGQASLGLLLAALGLRAAVNAFFICAHNSWMRDLIPDASMGDFYARRMRASYLAGLLTGLLGGFLIDLLGGPLGGAVRAYAFLFVVAFVAGELATLTMARVPEPAMPPADGRSLGRRLLEPVRDGNYRRFLGYFALWNLTTAMATPLFVIFMLRRLGYPITWVVLLEGAGKLAHLATLGIWGRLADQHSSRAVVAAAQPLYWASLLLWPVAGLLGPASPLTLVLIAGIYVINRVAAAGIGIGNNTLAMQLAPRGGATPYLAVRSLVMNPVTFAAPVLGGFLADQLGRLPLFAGAARLSALDAVLILAALVGVLSALVLRGVSQPGAADVRTVRADFVTAIVNACKARLPGASARRRAGADVRSS
jgi:MFS family permease